MASIREMMMGSWEGRGNAKSAGTHDAPIPGMITSRRVRPIPKKKPMEAHKPQMVFPQQKPKKNKEKKRSRSKRRRRSTSPSPRTAQQALTTSPGTVGGVAAGKQDDSAAPEQPQAAPEPRPPEITKRPSRDPVEEERMRRKAQAAEWARQQAEREAKRQEEARLAEEQRQKHAARAAERKKNLKGAFAVAGDDELDQEAEEGKEKIKIKISEKQQKKSTLAMAFEQLGNEASSSKLPQPSPEAQIVTLGAAARDNNGDAVALRAALADPSAVRSFAPGEVAEKYKLLMEMKRKFRRPDFGGPAEKRSRSPSREPPKRQREKERDRDRDRDRRRGGRSRSGSKSRYDSVWIRPR